MILQEIRPFYLDEPIKEFDEDHKIYLSKAGMRSTLEIYCICGQYCEFLAKYTLNIMKEINGTDFGRCKTMLVYTPMGEIEAEHIKSDNCKQICFFCYYDTHQYCVNEECQCGKLQVKENEI